MNDQTLEQDLKAIRGKRIFFGHQSVGGNIIEGIRDLTAGRSDVNVNIVDLAKTPRPAGPYFGELRIGKNSHPATKCDAFSRTVQDLLGDSLDIAVMKFCYVDFDGTTQPGLVFSNYRSMIDSLKRLAPGVTFVHATVPLTVRTPGWKKLLKRILGRGESSDLLNGKRQEFNELLRKQYQNEGVFDLASVESTYPDGSREEFMHDGSTAYSLIPALSDDGAHLNRAGRDVAARELVRSLAQAALRGRHQ